MKNTRLLGLTEKKPRQRTKPLARDKYELSGDLIHDIVNQLTFLTLCSFKLRTSLGTACPQELEAIEISIGKIADLTHKLLIHFESRKKKRSIKQIHVRRKGTPSATLTRSN